MSRLAVKPKPAESKLARPLKVLVPLIQQELEAGTSAGLEHYRRAGAMLLEARESGQVPAFKWKVWLSKNFTLSHDTARRYMRLAEIVADGGGRAGASTLHEAIGEKHTRTPRLSDLFPHKTSTPDRDRLAQERQTVEEEVRLHREIATQLVDAGYRALATRLHPDQGGSRDAMRRLNRVRDDLKSLATTRRFV